MDNVSQALEGRGFKRRKPMRNVRKMKYQMKKSRPKEIRATIKRKPVMPLIRRKPFLSENMRKRRNYAKKKNGIKRV